VGKPPVKLTCKTRKDKEGQLRKLLRYYTENATWMELTRLITSAGFGSSGTELLAYLSTYLYVTCNLLLLWHWHHWKISDMFLHNVANTF
jgi:hypothetical protein